MTGGPGRIGITQRKKQRGLATCIGRVLGDGSPRLTLSLCEISGEPVEQALERCFVRERKSGGIVARLDERCNLRASGNRWSCGLLGVGDADCDSEEKECMFHYGSVNGVNERTGEDSVPVT